jgi:mannose-6-phosphate isomerase-like protein (cupin superfamily)
MDKKEIIYKLDKDGSTYIFHGEPDSTAPAVEFNSVLEPGAPGPEPHVHTKQKETFYVVSGTMIARVKGQEEKILGPGETIVVPVGVVHSFTNGSKDEPLMTRITVEPALDFQWFITEAAKLAINNGGSMKKIPLQEAGYLMWLSRDQQRMGGVPYFIQDILFGLLTMLARISGRTRNISPKPR